MHENTYMAPNNLCGFIPLSAFWLAPDQQRLADVCCFRHMHKAITLAQGRRKAKGGGYVQENTACHQEFPGRPE